MSDFSNIIDEAIARFHNISLEDQTHSIEINTPPIIMAPPVLDIKLFAFVPTFDGSSSSHLNKFIQSVESLITTYSDTVVTNPQDK